MEKGAFNQTFMTGQEYLPTGWPRPRQMHVALMKSAGFLAK
jgi:hypothetical protein